MTVVFTFPGFVIRLHCHVPESELDGTRVFKVLWLRLSNTVQCSEDLTFPGGQHNPCLKCFIGDSSLTKSPLAATRVFKGVFMIH